MKTIITFCVAIFLLSSISSIDVSVTPLEQYAPAVYDSQYPTEITLSIKNNGVSEEFSIYSLVGFDIIPDKIFLYQGQEKNITFKIIPLNNLRGDGFYSFEYFIKGGDGEERNTILLKVMKLSDFFDIWADKINLSSNSFKIHIKNKERISFDDLKVSFHSLFFDKSERISISPFGEEEISIELNKNRMNQILAGFYTMKVSFELGGVKDIKEIPIEFKESKEIISNISKKGFFIQRIKIEKENKGNTLLESIITEKKNILAALFTTTTVEPDVKKIKGFYVYYLWKRNLKPSEKLEILITTNWFYPIFIVLLVLALVYFIINYSRKDVLLLKKVKFGKTKKGNFALKVSLVVKARKDIKNLRVVDKFPSVLKLHHKFGVEEPSHVDEKRRVIEWNFEEMKKGEAKVLSYILYSNVKVIGKFALPLARAYYEKNSGKSEEEKSNRAFLVYE